jgi:hypothetical protein
MGFARLDPGLWEMAIGRYWTSMAAILASLFSQTRMSEVLAPDDKAHCTRPRNDEGAMQRTGNEPTEV